MKTFKITEEQDNPRGKKIVNAILEQEIASAKAGHTGTISRSNYDFVFLRDQNFGAIPEYVLHIIPKRKEKGPLLGDIWVDAQRRPPGDLQVAAEQRKGTRSRRGS
jgi:hypothetical protein